MGIVVDPEWDPPVGRLFLRETGHDAELGFVTHPRATPGAVIQYRTLAQRRDGETRPLFCGMTDSAEGRVCFAQSGIKIRRYEPNDHDLRVFLETWSRRPPTMADWLLDLPEALAVDEAARLRRIVSEMTPVHGSTATPCERYVPSAIPGACACGTDKDLHREPAAPGSTAPTAAVDPPIELVLHVHMDGEARSRAFRHINRLHGFPAGVPMDQQAPADLQAAAHQVVAGRQVVLRVVAIDKNGACTFVLRDPAPASRQDDTALDVKAARDLCAVALGDRQRRKTPATYDEIAIARHLTAALDEIDAAARRSLGDEAEIERLRTIPPRVAEEMTRWSRFTLEEILADQEGSVAALLADAARDGRRR